MGQQASTSVLQDQGEAQDIGDNVHLAMPAVSGELAAAAPSTEPGLTGDAVRDLIARGLRPDLSLLPFQMPRMSFDGIPPPPIETTTTRLTNPANLTRSSIRFVDSRLVFSFDAPNVPCKVTVFLMAKDSVPQTSSSLGAADPISGTVLTETYRAGTGLQYQSPEPINVSSWPVSALVHDPLTNLYPIIIRLEPVAAPSKSPVAPASSQQITSQTTYCTLIHQEGSVDYFVRVVRQTVAVDRRTYKVEEVFGLEAAAGSDCVICMSAPRTTALLPCKHCIVCSICAETLRTQTAKCPICRSAVFKLLQIKSDQ